MADPLVSKTLLWDEVVGVGEISLSSRYSCILVSFTGTQRFCDDIKDMIGFAPGLYWRFCWRFAAPLFLMVSHLYPSSTFTEALCLQVFKLWRLPLFTASATASSFSHYSR